MIKPFIVAVQGFSEKTYYASSRGKALAEAWHSYRHYRDISFGQFLRIARAYRGVGSLEFGKQILVSGLSAFLVSRDSERGYVRFVRPDSDVVLLSHPNDVMEDAP